MARQVAEQSDFTKTHVGCLITYRGQVISSGCNSNKTHPMQKKYNIYREQDSSFIPKVHAEITALCKLKNKNIDMRKVKLYVYRIKKNGSYGMARPCPSCMAAIKDIGINHILYTTNDGYAEELLNKEELC